MKQVSSFLVISFFSTRSLCGLDEDITEDVAKNKFRNVPEERHLDKSGSLIELQTKLQTISETTESDHSIPRKNSLITTALYKIDKEVQATPCVRSVGICPDYSRLFNKITQK